MVGVWSDLRIGFVKIKTAKNGSEGCGDISANFRTNRNFPRYGSPVSAITNSLSELTNFPGSFVPQGLPVFTFQQNNTQKKSHEKKSHGVSGRKVDIVWFPDPS